MSLDLLAWIAGLFAAAVAVAAVTYIVRRERWVDGGSGRAPTGLASVLTVLLVALAGALAATLVAGLT